MNKRECNSKESTLDILNVITKLVQNVEKIITVDNVNAKQCEELKLLKGKCCDSNVVVALTAFQAVHSLVEKKILIGSQVVSILLSLLPSVKHYCALVSAVGNILILDLKEQLSKNDIYECYYNKGNIQHPLITILKCNKEKSWFEICLFIQHIMQTCDDIKFQHKAKLVYPIFHHVFWNSEWRGSQFQHQLFNVLMMQKLDEKHIINFTLEMLLWQSIDIYYCLFLQELCTRLLSMRTPESEKIISALTLVLAQVIKWLIVNGHNPEIWIKTLSTCITISSSTSSTVLYILTDVIMETPPIYINFLIDICKSIIYSTFCNIYVVYKFIAVILNWFVNPSPLADPMYKTVEELLKFINKSKNNWKDQTSDLVSNEYYKTFENVNKDTKFAVNLIRMSESWNYEKQPIISWLKNLNDSNVPQIQFSLHTFICGIILCESDNVIVKLCINLLFKLLDHYQEISFSYLCIIFYKLGRETDPLAQKTYLSSLPKLAVKKENIPLIVNVIESLKKGTPKIMVPLVIQLYLDLWKFDQRIYFCLHKILHEPPTNDFSWELNVSKALALREICKVSPNLHGKDLVGVLSKILNECDGNLNELPSSLAIEAVTELCKSYVIDVSGTWRAVEPKLRKDKRPKVVISLCKMFSEIPKLNSSSQKYDQLIEDVIPMLWDYTFFDNVDVVKSAFEALSNFNVENLPLRLLPEIYRINLQPQNSENGFEDLEYVPAECWIQFLEKISTDILKDAGNLLVVMIERELNSLPRSIFYLPATQPEPISYSYLPKRSICRALVDRMRNNPTNQSTKEIIRIMAHNYTKTLPPLDWTFLKKFLEADSQYSKYCLALLAKQGHSSRSAKFIFEDYLQTTEWTSDMLEDIIFLYGVLPMICKTVSHNILQNFLERTIELSLNSALEDNTDYFERKSLYLVQALTSETIQLGHKSLIAKQLEKIITKIPPEHKVMKSYALCAAEFPVKSVLCVSSLSDSNEVNPEWLRRAVIIRCAIALRSDIKNPLVWLNEFTDAVEDSPEDQDFILKTILSIIRSRRSCDHSGWMHELMWKIQESIISVKTSNSYGVTLFLISVFVSATIVLSGYDSLFVDVSQIAINSEKKLDIFPLSLFTILNFPNWIELLPKMGVWLQKISKWKHLPNEYVKSFTQCLLVLKSSKCFTDENTSVKLMNITSLSFI